MEVKEPMSLLINKLIDEKIEEYKNHRRKDGGSKRMSSLRRLIEGTHNGSNKSIFKAVKKRRL
ncbi:MAG TPA: hypothetical protein DEG69_15920 [Flavobacteriaceae bacterium]|nr:hypothetical protein [Flavobacteriaceae bacterium]|tara:strand:- start:321 stop:509 length:189 start_codon:yes stop_codon:yes gene_type:complete